ncbi:hypothetical protein N9O47_02955 [Candidatus Pelagibacter sp.]|nr:hypothetical protein [Candidatus Pelagibacter sp.]
MLNKNLIFNNYNLYLATVFIFWIISIILYFFLNDYVKAGSLENGVKFGADSKFYIRQATMVLNGEASILDYKSKFGYILFLTPFIYFDIPFVLIVCFQLLLTAISAWCLYKITTKFFCKLSGIICVALFLLYFPLQIRNFYILTEMLFIDITIILTYLIVFFKRYYLPIIIFLIFFLISIRPNGILFLFSILASTFYFFIKYKKYFFLSLILLGSMILFLPTINLLNSYIVDLNLIDSISSKGIIWGWSLENNERCRISCLGVELINQDFQNNIFDIFNFILINFIDFFKIFLLKVFWLLLRARPYYSDLHNYYILFFDVIFYIGFIYGLYKIPKNNFSINVILFFIFFSICLVGLTFADWSGRFSLYFLPLIMIFSSHGVLIFIKKFLKIIYKT